MSDDTNSTNDEPRRHFEIRDHVERLNIDDTATKRCGDNLNSSSNLSRSPSTSLLVIAAIGIVAGGVAAMMLVSSLPSSDGSPVEMTAQTPAQKDKSDVTIDYAEVVQHAHTVKSQLDQERAARIAAEEKALLSASEAEALKRAHALVEATAAQDRARFESVKVSRQASTDLYPASRETSTSKAAVSTPAAWDAQVSVSTGATSAPPEPLPQNNVVVAPINEQPTRAAEAKSIPPQPLQVAEKSPQNGHAELLAGQKHLSAGNLKAARHAFERAAQLGRPEGALAVGNTFDPVSLAKIGVQASGDTARARLWYRRAYDIVLAQQQKLAQQNP
ncbi:MAG: hypothetical protein CTY31_06810 [Hyphomicrobium sp.]|nr:MAG: hypothetical protein CTY39_05455 [Hyphomicrobium sp.]PPD00773.1 MAG: hypothetical protein CTY31_06810 [Hyphomicrobium sp.]